MILRLALVTLLLVACGSTEAPQEEPGSIIDLARIWSEAEILTETERIDLGAASAHGHLREGWSWDERSGDLTFAWAVGDHSTVEVVVVEPRELVLVVRCFPFPAPDMPPQSLTVTWNETRLGTLELSSGPGAYRLPVPAAAVRSGRNRLTLRPGWSRIAREVVGGDDRRRLAIAFDELIVEGAEPSGRATADGPVLRLQGPIRIDWHLELPEAARVSWARVVGAPGAPEPRFEAQRAGDPGGTSARLATGDHLILPRPGIWRLSLVLPAAGHPTAWRLMEPRILLLGGAASESAGASPPPSRSSSQRPDVVVFSVDTLRADRLGCYGGAEGVSPMIDAFAAQSIRFEHALAHSSWTKPTVASLLTGLGPLSHGVVTREHALPQEVVTVAERFRDAGFATAAFVANAYLTREAGFAQGFDTFHYAPEDAARVVERAQEWLASRPPGEPFFLFVHTVDPHAPYEPPPSERQRFAPDVPPAVGTFEQIRALGDGRVAVTEALVDDLFALYDAEIAATDRAFGDLLATLEARRRWPDTLVAFVADHGEAFHEHGVFGHGWDLSPEVLHVPLLLRLPGGPPGGRVATSVQQVDLVPTLLDAAGLDRGTLLGPSLLAPPTRRAAFSYLEYDERRGASLEWGGWKLVQPLGPGFGPGRVLYRIDDPAEEVDLSDRHPVIAGYLATLLRRELARRSSGATPEQDALGPERREALAALGYL